MADPAPSSLDKKLIRTSPLLWIMGLVFAGFLGALGTQGLSDAADVFAEPSYNEFAAHSVDPLEEQRSALEGSPDPRAAALRSAQVDVEGLQAATQRAEQSWRTWLETRATLGKEGKEDDDVRARRDRLEKLRAELSDATLKLERLRREPDPRETARRELERKISAARAEARAEFEAAHRTWTWKVLAARMALVVPVWLVAVALWRRRDRTPYITLLWGYWAFSVWMLLWGIGPYLPHYGGYGPLALGGALSVWGSISLARWFNRRAPARRRRIVDQAIAKHRCPSCERDYLLGRETALEVGVVRKATLRHYDANALRPSACAACGLPLFAPCPKCQTVQLVHVERCAACGEGWPQPAV